MIGSLFSSFRPPEQIGFLFAIQTGVEVLPALSLCFFLLSSERTNPIEFGNAKSFLHVTKDTMALPKRGDSAMPVGDSVHLLEEKTKMIDRDIQEPSWQEELPIELRPLLDRTNWRMVTIGCSGMHVFHVRDGYLKIADQRRGVKSTLFGEYERLCWLQGQLPVPQVYHYSKSASFEYLYLSEIVGVMACDQQFQADMPLFLRLLAEALHMVHDIESDQCPFPRLLQSRMEQMRQKIASRTLNLSAFSAAHQGATPQEWLTQLEQLQPTTEDLVFVHGDFCLPNILIDPQKRCVNGLIDWGLCGIADRYMDLDTASWSLGYNFDPSWIPGLFDAYGLKTVDQKKLIFYRALDRT